MKSRYTRFEGFEGISLAADVWGDDGAPPVVLMHGGGQTRHAWGSTARALAAAGWRAIALDLRGHGDSSWAHNGDYSFSTFAADCIAVCDQLGGRRCSSAPRSAASPRSSPRATATASCRAGS